MTTLWDRSLMLSNGNIQYFRVVDGMAFEVALLLNDGTLKEYSRTVDDKFISVLLRAYKYKFRIRIWYGDTETGRAWNEEYDVMGTVGRTTGNIKIPILVYSKKSWGGSALLMGNIIRIDDIEDRRTLWQVPDFHVEKMEVVYKNGDYPFQVMQTKDNGEVVNVANFKTEMKAYHYIDFMNGKRYAK